MFCKGKIIFAFLNGNTIFFGKDKYFEMYTIFWKKIVLINLILIYLQVNELTEKWINKYILYIVFIM